MEFFETVMGHRFYEGTMPSIAKNLATVSETLGLMKAVMERQIQAIDRQTKAIERQNELKEIELGLRPVVDIKALAEEMTGKKG